MSRQKFGRIGGLVEANRIKRHDLPRSLLLECIFSDLSVFFVNITKAITQRLMTEIENFNNNLDVFNIYYSCDIFLAQVADQSRINRGLRKLSRVTRQVSATGAKRSFGILLSRKEEQVVGLKYHARVPGIPARNSFISFCKLSPGPF